MGVYSLWRTLLNDSIHLFAVEIDLKKNGRTSNDDSRNNMVDAKREHMPCNKEAECKVERKQSAV